MMHPTALNRFTRYALLNLLLVAAIGVVLRYKIAFYFPWIDQKHLLHAHSHFAFSGWVSHLLMVLLVRYLVQQSITGTWRMYRLLINANLVCAYGMLFSFSWQGYGMLSISFSTASIFISYVFAVQFWKDRTG